MTAWLFGLGYFHQDGYDAWAIVVGSLFLLAYWEAHELRSRRIRSSILSPPAKERLRLCPQPAWVAPMLAVLTDERFASWGCGATSAHIR